MDMKVTKAVIEILRAHVTEPDAALMMEWVQGSLNRVFPSLSIGDGNGKNLSSGTGSLAFESDRAVLRLSAARATALFDHSIQQMTEGASGQFVAPSHYNSVSAIDADERKWTFERTRLHGTFDASATTSLFGEVRSASATQTREPKNCQCLWLCHLFENEPLYGECSDWMPVGQTEKGSTSVRCWRTGPIACARGSVTAICCDRWLCFLSNDAPEPSRMWSHIEQAMLFGLGRPVDPLAFVTSEASGVIHLRSPRSRRKSAFPPIRPVPTDNGAVWRGVRAYLSYLSQMPGEPWPAVSKVAWHLDALEETPSWVHALALSSCVEGLVSDVAFPQPAPSGSAADKEQLRVLLEFLPTGNTYKKRVPVWLEFLDNESAANRIRHAVELGVLTKENQKAWKGRRHGFAHGSIPDDTDQDLLNDLWQLRDAAYRCIFQIIKYSGPRVDYGVIGWPEGKFAAV